MQAGSDVVSLKDQNGVTHQLTDRGYMTLCGFTVTPTPWKSPNESQVNGIIETGESEDTVLTCIECVVYPGRR